MPGVKGTRAQEAISLECVLLLFVEGRGRSKAQGASSLEGVLVLVIEGQGHRKPSRGWGHGPWHV